MPSTKCCRSSPRCADCPARLVAASRPRPRGPGVASLVEEILLGGAPRPLPQPVLAALATLEAAARRDRPIAMLSDPLRQP